MSRLVTLLRPKAGGVSITYLLRDLFTTPAAAPLTTPRTAEPGPGAGTITDTTNKLSISGMALVSTGINAGGDPRIMYAGVPRVAGRTLLYSFQWTTVMRGSSGWSTSATPTTNPTYGYGDSSGVLGVCADGSNYPITGLMTANTTYDIALVLRSTGFFALRRSAPGSYTLDWVNSGGNDATLYPGAWARTTAFTVTLSNLRITDLTDAWATDYGLATQYVASPGAGEVTTMETSALIEFTWTPSAGQTLDIDFRRIDAGNGFVCRCVQASNTIAIVRRTAGAETSLNSVAQTWTAGSTYRIVVIADGSTLKSAVGNAAKNSTTSSSHSTGTGVISSLAGLNLVTWPRTIAMPDV